MGMVEGRAHGGVRVGDMDRSSHETELKKTEAPFSGSNLENAGLTAALTSRRGSPSAA